MAGHIEMGEQMVPLKSNTSATADEMKDTNQDDKESEINTEIVDEENKDEEKLQNIEENYQVDLYDSDEDSNDNMMSMELSQPGKKKKKHVTSADPFIARDLPMELSEIINSFDMIKYGSFMAQLVINEIKEEFDMEQLWIILGVVMEAVPFSMALEILNREIDTLKRGNPEQMEALCLEMVDGTNWRISSALRMAEYFKNISDEDEFQADQWMEISKNFETIAHKSINSIDSDHLLYALLTIPLYDTSQPVSIIKLALEQKNTFLLNKERVNRLITHTWFTANPLNPNIRMLAHKKDPKKK
eukprot:861903_1